MTLAVTTVADNHNFLAAGMAAGIVIAIGALAICAYQSFQISVLREQVETLVEEATPSMADVLADDQPGEDSFKAVGEPEPVAPDPAPRTEAREFGGHTFRFAVESPRADESPREAEAVQGLSRGGSDRRPSPTPRS